MPTPIPDDRRFASRLARARPYLAASLVALFGFVAFWMIAVDAHGFLDEPFDYIGQHPFVDNLLLSPGRGPRLFELALAAASFVCVLPAMLVVAAALGRRRDPRLALASRFDASPRALVALAAFVASAMAAFVSFGLVQGASIIDDERAYAFEAQLLAHGHVALPSPPAALRNPMILTEPSWTSKYPPGQSLALTLGALAGEPRIVPIVLASVLVVAIFVTSSTVLGRRQGLLAAALTAASPMVWAQYGTLMAFGTSAAALAVCLAGLARSAARPQGTAAPLVAGIALGFMALVRPQECLPLGLPIAVVLTSQAIRGHIGARRRFLLVGVSAAAVASLLFVHDRLVTGSAFRLPWALDVDSVALGFRRPLSFLPYEHTLAASFSNVLVAVSRLDAWVLGWTGSLAFAAIGLARASTPFERLMIAMLATFVLLMTMAPTTGTWDCGPSYYVIALPILIPLTVRGVSATATALEGVANGRFARAALWLPVIGAFASALTIAPVHLFNLAVLAGEIRAPWELIASQVHGDAIVILPVPLERHAVGWALGYPYSIATGPGTDAKLIEPHTPEEADEAIRALGPHRATYALSIDHARYLRDGQRRYWLTRISPGPH